jgi:hypothetical protein
MRWFLGFHIVQLRCSAPNSETDRRRRERRYGRKEDAEFDGSPTADMRAEQIKHWVFPTAFATNLTDVTLALVGISQSRAESKY